MLAVVQVPPPGQLDLSALTAFTGGAVWDVSIQGAARSRTQKKFDSLEAWCSERRFDLAYVPNEHRIDRVGLVAFDMDSTLITIECIDEIADMQGIRPQVSAITESAMRGEIDFAESLRRRVALLEGLDESALVRVYEERLRLSPGALEMLAAFRQVGATTLLVSGGFTFFTDRLKSRLNLDFTASNVLGVRDGVLSGTVIGDVFDARAKAEAVRKLRDRPGMKGKLTVAIGDGANDLPMMAEADVSVAYHAKPVVRAKTTHQIDFCGLDAVVNLFNP